MKKHTLGKSSVWMNTSNIKDRETGLRLILMVLTITCYLKVHKRDLRTPLTPSWTLKRISSGVPKLISSKDMFFFFCMGKGMM